MVRFGNWLFDYLTGLGMNEQSALVTKSLICAILLFVVLFLLDVLLRRVIVSAFQYFSDKTRTSFDDFLVRSNFPKYTAHLVPFVILLYYIPIIFEDFPKTGEWVLHITDVYLILLVVWIFRSVIKTTRDFLKSLPAYKDKPLDSFAQVIIIFVWLFGTVFIFSEVTGQSVVKFLTTLGAASAIIILLFKDTILGFVASIQVSINDMVRIGDWITLEKYGADGTVIEINLTTVKIQNFDHTITTIPTYKLISDSFKNWRGMQDGAGRRIKKALLIKTESIHFLTKEDLERFRKIDLVAAYIDHRQTDIDTYNKKQEVDKTLLLNGRNQTNIGVFRKYAESYVGNHAAINNDLMVMVRYLEPTPHGVPLEIYAFSKDKRWQNYEYIIADIFDHLISAAPYFDLEYVSLSIDVSK